MDRPGGRVIGRMEAVRSGAGHRTSVRCPPQAWLRALKPLRPFSITAGALILFALWAWISMSNIEYRPGRFAGGRTTAGWFVLGSPFLFGLGLLVSLFFSFVARRTRLLYGCLCLLAVFVPLIVFALIRTTPAARLRTALDVEPPAGTQIQRIEQFDSFNDGSTIAGVCSASPQLVQTLIAPHALKASDSGGILHQVLRDEPIPEEGRVFAGDELTIYYDADRSLLYFCRRLGQRRRS